MKTKEIIQVSLQMMQNSCLSNAHTYSTLFLNPTGHELQLGCLASLFCFSKGWLPLAALCFILDHSNDILAPQESENQES